MILNKDIEKIHKIEVPCNFRPTYWRGLSIMSQFKDYIKFVYLPCWKEDNIKNTRHYAWGDPWSPKTWEEYLKVLEQIKLFNVEICILLQKDSTFDIFKKYYDLGIKYYILNNDLLAQEIKNKDNNIDLSLSITRMPSFEELCENDFSMYNEIVLPFWANRNLDLIKQLPKKYKYCLMLNSMCYWNCQQHEYHWFHPPGDCTTEMKILTSGENSLECAKLVREDRDSIYIYPEDIHYFAPYVHSYKLIDRTIPTRAIVEGFISYIIERSCEDNRMKDIDMDYLFKYNCARPEDFYNIDKSILPSYYYINGGKDFYDEQRMEEEEIERLKEKYGERNYRF